MSWSKCNATVTFHSLSHFTSIATELCRGMFGTLILNLGCSFVLFNCVFLTFWHCIGFIGLVLLQDISQIGYQWNYQHVCFNEESSSERFLCVLKQEVSIGTLICTPYFDFCFELIGWQLSKMNAKPWLKMAKKTEIKVKNHTDIFWRKRKERLPTPKQKRSREALSGERDV